MSPDGSRRNHRPEVGPRYKWTALSNTTLGVFMAALDSSIVLISLPAIFRGIHLDPLRAEQRELPALDADGLPRGDRGARRHLRSPRRHVRPRAHVQRGLPHLHHRVDPAVAHTVHRFAGRAVAHRLPRRAGRRRRAAARQLDRHPHRRVPGHAARHGHGHQHGRRHRRAVRRPRRRRTARRHRLAPHLLGERAGRRVRDGVGLPQAEGGRRPARGAHGLVGQRHVRRSA